MFGLFKRKPKSAMSDTVSQGVYDKNAKKTAVLPMSVTLAHTTLLQSQIPYELLERIATELDATSLPYSTHDLAASTAFSILKEPGLPGHMVSVAVGAIEEMQAWSRAGLMAPVLADSFVSVIAGRLESLEQESKIVETQPLHDFNLDDLRGYIISRIMDAPELIMVKFIMSGTSLESLQNNVEVLADICVRRMQHLGSTGALLEELDQLSQIWTDKMEEIVENRGGLFKIKTWPADLADGVGQVVGKMFIFQDVLTNYYHHQPTIEKYGFINAE